MPGHTRSRSRMFSISKKVTGVQWKIDASKLARARAHTRAHSHAADCFMRETVNVTLTPVWKYISYFFVRLSERFPRKIRQMRLRSARSLAVSVGIHGVYQRTSLYYVLRGFPSVDYGNVALLQLGLRSLQSRRYRQTLPRKAIVPFTLTDTIGRALSMRTHG